MDLIENEKERAQHTDLQGDLINLTKIRGDIQIERKTTKWSHNPFSFTFFSKESRPIN
jgi:hypothetical protein